MIEIGVSQRRIGDIIAGKRAITPNTGLRLLYQQRIVISGHGIDKNIADILKAIDALLSLNGIDVSGIRLQLDNLLRIWGGRYYLNSMN